MDKAGGIDKLVVGLEDEAEIIKQRLTRGTTALDFVSIVGMGGIGKTTMARKVYQALEYHFHIRAFCCVSQTYDKRKLLLEILPQVTQLPNKTEEMSYEDLGELLYRSLKGRRYLIIMDDVWDIRAWNDLGIYFPNDNNESRILFTSRQNDVLLQVKPNSPPHCLRLLSEEESWELLEKAAFDQRGCPPELLGVGRKIAKSCQRLPLAIVVVAGILARTEQEQGKWEQIAENVSTDTQTECSHIFELSYKHLPEHLKPCFLYLAAFQEDFQIPVRKLIQLWIAEGFIPRIGHKCLEDLAEVYLIELIGRNLVMVSERSSMGGCKTFHLHDLLLDFCSGKAKEEKFVQCYKWLDAFGSLDVSNPRLCYYYQGGFNNLSKSSISPSLSSLLFFGVGSYIKNYSFISSLKHLAVLDLGDYCTTEYFFTLDLPTQLRYLAVCGIIEYIPPSISHLSKLETLVVTTLLRKPIDLPYTIWEMGTLRHLQINGNSSFKLPEPRGKLENLQTLCFLSSHTEDTHEVLSALPRLRRLKFCASSAFIRPIFKFLTQLESLHIDCSRGFVLSSFFDDLPAHLKKLTVSHILLYDREISQIGRLPNLEVLKILSGNFEKDNWDMGEDDKFLKLKFLKINGSRIEKWNASSDHFPCLKKLFIHRCGELQSIPLSIGENPSLQLIDVQWCSHSVASSVREIQEAQMDMGNEELQVYINPQD